MTLPPELETLKQLALQTSTAQWARDQGWKLRQTGNELIGPCPKCGGIDRFGINLTTGAWNCRHCGVGGGDVIFLVQHVEGLTFVLALERITGRTPAAPIDPAELAKVRAENEQREREKAAENDRYREAARRTAYEIWVERAHKPSWPVSSDGSTTPRYLKRRGIDLGCADHEWVHGDEILLREIDEHPWREQFTDERGYKAWRTIASAPAMIAPVQLADGKFGAVHQTWIDLSQPKGKLVLPPDDAGKERPSKKVLGAKKGGAIRLYTPETAERIVMGEGIETTLTALAHAYQHGTAYWAGVDLGNMSGRALRGPTGGQIYDQPDMDDLDCFLPPDWCEELVYICDGDEAQKHTVEKVTRGLRRALRYRSMQRAERPELPSLSIMMVPPGEAGTDLNSIAMADAAAVRDGA